MNILAVIPARGGSKGLAKKNIKMLHGKPLIYWTIDVVRKLLPDEDICVSTDCLSIIETVEARGLKVPFIRPENLATDSATTRDVLIHALEFYKEKGKSYDVVLLLQPTSPLRNLTHIKEAIALYKADIDMVVSVKKSDAAAVLTYEGKNGFLELPFNSKVVRRQDMSEYYEYNGAVYVINVNSLYANASLNFNKKIKYVMGSIESIDIDTQIDFDFVEFIINKYIDKGI